MEETSEGFEERDDHSAVDYHTLKSRKRTLPARE
jgi:hypothetical protein